MKPKLISFFRITATFLMIAFSNITAVAQSRYCDTNKMTVVQTFAAWQGRYVPDSCYNYMTWNSYYNKLDNPMHTDSVGGVTPGGIPFSTPTGKWANSLFSQQAQMVSPTINFAGDTIASNDNLRSNGLTLESYDNVTGVKSFISLSADNQNFLFYYPPDNGALFQIFNTGNTDNFTFVQPSSNTKGVRFYNTSPVMCSLTYNSAIAKADVLVGNQSSSKGLTSHAFTSTIAFGVATGTSDTILAKPQHWISVVDSAGNVYRLPAYK